MNQGVRLYGLYEIPNGPSESREKTAMDLVIPVKNAVRTNDVRWREHGSSSMEKAIYI